VTLLKATRALAGAFVVLSILSACRRDRKAVEMAAATLKERVESRERPDFARHDARGEQIWKDVRRFYRSHGYAPAWISGRRPGPEASELINAVHGAREEGLDPEDYDLKAIDALRTEKSRNPFKKDALPPEHVAEAELRLTYMFLRYATHLLQGRVEPSDVDAHWFGQQRRMDLVDLLGRALDSGDVAEALKSVLPRHAQYAALKRELARYREIAAHGGWPRVPGSAVVKKGSRGPEVAALRARLAAEGDLAQAGGDVFDGTAEAALKRFEKRYGLNEDGVLGPDDRTAMNVPVEDRAAQIELNLERWRWLPEELGERYVVINVPTFQLEAMEHGKVVLSMRVVAGKADETPTPIFSDEMTEVVFSPYWNVPTSILRKETIPAVLQDPDYLNRNDLEVVRAGQVVSPDSVDWSDPDERIQVRQRPGAKNSLGLVKFLFPNKFDVYLHDTPADSLFERLERDFSHGCVRVEKPVELAQWVLRDQPEWTPEKIQAAMHAGQERHVALKRRIPVYIVYATAWVDEGGRLNFRDDLYGHDRRQRALLGRERPQSTRVTRAG
jgi:murein L,D-transpeptidase YcbB/YkuD